MTENFLEFLGIPRILGIQFARDDRVGESTYYLIMIVVCRGYLGLSMARNKFNCTSLVVDLPASVGLSLSTQLYLLRTFFLICLGAELCCLAGTIVNVPSAFIFIMMKCSY